MMPETGNVEQLHEYKNIEIEQNSVSGILPTPI